MKKLYSDLNREPCFAEISVDRCKALREKNCHECNFYKPATSQIKVAIRDILKDIDSCSGVVSDQKLKTLRGQVRSGDVDGARKGLDRIKKTIGL